MVVLILRELLFVRTYCGAILLLHIQSVSSVDINNWYISIVESTALDDRGHVHVSAARPIRRMLVAENE